MLRISYAQIPLNIRLLSSIRIGLTTYSSDQNAETIVLSFLAASKSVLYWKMAPYQWHEATRHGHLPFS